MRRVPTFSLLFVPGLMLLAALQPPSRERLPILVRVAELEIEPRYLAAYV